MINTFIFDINGVLNLPVDTVSEKNVLNSFDEVISELQNLGLESEKNRKGLFDAYRKSSINLISRDEMINEMASLLSCNPDNLVDYIHSIYSNGSVENKKLYGFLETVANKKLLKIGILSTQFPLSKDVLVPQKYYDTFDSLEISCESKIYAKKPAENVFKKIIEELDANPGNVIFVDDQQKYIDISKQLGINSIWFINNEQLASDLGKFDIPSGIVPLLNLLN